MSALAGLHVLVTRPAHQAETLCRLLADEGAVPLRLPLLAIEPPRDAAPAHARLARAADYDWLIFTSANAVVAVAPRLTAIRGPRLAGIGGATARAMTGAGLPPDLLPAAGASSEALLAAPALHAVRGRRVLLVKGEGGRDVLARTLRERGARVDEAAVYRRVPLSPQTGEIIRLLGLADVAVVTSGEALTQLMDVTPETARTALLRLQLVVASDRVVKTAEQKGFIARPIAPATVSDAGFVDAIRAWARGSGFPGRTTNR